MEKIVKVSYLLHLAVYFLNFYLDSHHFLLVKKIGIDFNS